MRRPDDRTVTGEAQPEGLNPVLKSLRFPSASRWSLGLLVSRKWNQGYAMKVQGSKIIA